VDLFSVIRIRWGGPVLVYQKQEQSQRVAKDLMAVFLQLFDGRPGDGVVETLRVRMSEYDRDLQGPDLLCQGEWVAKWRLGIRPLCYGN